MSAPPPRKPRPPLPGGPFLVVGLARSGQAAARLLAARGEEVRGGRFGTSRGAAGLAGVGVEVVLDTDGLAQLEGTRTVVKSPGVPREAPVIAAALERGIDVIGELELAWRAIPNRFLAVTGTNGKTTTVELLGHIYRDGRRAGRGRRQRRHPALLAGRRGRARRDRRLRGLQLPARGHASPSPPSAPSSSTSRPTTSTATATSSPTWRRSCGSSPTRATTTSPSTTPTTRRWPASTSAAARRRIAFCRGAGARLRGGAVAEGTIFYDGEPLLAVDELGLFGEHNVANAMAAAAAALAMGIDRDAVREGLRSFAGVPHRLEPVAEIGGVRFVNDSKATNVASADGRPRAPSRAASTRSSAAARRASRSRRCSSRCASAAAACYLIGATAERLAAELAPVVEAGVELHRCADLEDAVRARRRRGRARRGRPALARLRQLRRLRELRSARRALPRDRRGAAA